jgi:hypothetical protein
MVPGMGEFFEPPPPEPHDPEPRYRTPAWAGPPEGTLPSTVPFDRVLARTAKVAVLISRLAAYPTGFEFQLIMLSDDADEDLEPCLFEMRRHRRRSSEGPEIPSEILRLGVQFADDSKATNVSPDRFGGSERSGPILMEMGGGGSTGRWRQDYWVWPLPPPGPMAFVCEWPAFGIPLARQELDAAVILDAASRAEVVFSDEHLPAWPSDEDGPQVNLIR